MAGSAWLVSAQCVLLLAGVLSLDSAPTVGTAEACFEGIGFVANLTGSWDVFVIHRDRERAGQLTDTVYDENELRWGRDRERILCSATDGRIRIIDVQTRQARQLAMGDKRGRATSPCFSPDRKRVVYVHFKPDAADDTELAVFGLEKKEHTTFLDQFGPQLFPDWSPDGKQIVYTSAHCGMECGRVIQELWIAEVKGRSARQLLMTNSHCTHPVWSRDGKKIAFSSDMNGNFDIWVVTLEDRRLEQITTDPHMDTSPAWSPDGRKMAFISGRTGRLKIWIKDLESGQLKMLSPFGDKDVECRDVAW